MFLIVWLLRRLLVLALLLAIPVLVGELVARKLVSDTVTSRVAASFGGSPSVGFGSTPLLMQLVEGHLNLTVSEPDASISGLPPVALKASFDDVHLTSLLGLHGAIGKVTAQASLGPVRVRDLLATSGCIAALPPSLAAVLTDHPRIRISSSDISLRPPRGRAVVLRVVPTAVGNKLDFAVLSLPAGGSATTIGAPVACVASVGTLPFKLSLVSATTTHGSLDLEFQGHGARFAA